MALETLILVDDFDVGTFGSVKTFHRQKTVDRNVCSYHYLRSNGLPLPVLPYSASDFSHSTPLGFYMQHDEKVKVTAKSVGGFLDYDVSSAEAIAKQKAAERFFSNGAGQNINIGVALGEMTQTMNMIGNTATRVARSFKALRHLDIHGAFNAVKMGNYSHRNSLIKRAKKGGYRDDDYKSNLSFAADAWLEMKYGWRPLLNDVEGAAKALAAAQEKDPADLKISGSAKAVIPVNPRNVPGWVITANGGGSVRVHHYAYFRILDQSIRGNQTLGLSNLQQVAWELIPYSFVVDWFLPVGKYIQALGAFQGLDYVRGGTSTKVSLSGSGSCNHVNGDVANFQETVNLNQFVRTASIPPPEAILSRPKSLKEALNLDKTVTALALMEQVFRK